MMSTATILMVNDNKSNKKTFRWNYDGWNLTKKINDWRVSYFLSFWYINDGREIIKLIFHLSLNNLYILFMIYFLRKCFSMLKNWNCFALVAMRKITFLDENFSLNFFPDYIFRICNKTFFFTMNIFFVICFFVCLYLIHFFIEKFLS